MGTINAQSVLDSIIPVIDFIFNDLICRLFPLIFIAPPVYVFYRKRKLKKLKNEGTGILKKVDISDIRRVYCSGDKDSSGYFKYRLEAKDKEGNIYRSDACRDLPYEGRTKNDMIRKYDGVIYDLSEKESALKQINANIQRLELELNDNPGFFKKRSLKRELETMKEYLDMANQGLINPYIIINGYKISVGDSVDIYIDPSDPKKYYFDLDFTNEK